MLTLILTLSCGFASFYYDESELTGCTCDEVGVRNGAYTCEGSATGSCANGWYCATQNGGSSGNMCKPGCVTEWEGSRIRPNGVVIRKTCDTANYPNICDEGNPFRDSSGYQGYHACPNCNECYPTCGMFDCGNAGRRDNPAECDGVCTFKDCCNYHFNFACDKTNVPGDEENPKWFDDLFLSDGGEGLLMESDQNNLFDHVRSVKYVIDSKLDSSIVGKTFVILEDCESTIRQSWRIFGVKQSGQREDITDRFGYGSPINDNGEISNQIDIHPKLRLNGGDCANYQMVNLMQMSELDGSGMVKPFKEYPRIEVEATMTTNSNVFRGSLKVNLHCKVETTGKPRESTVCESDDDCEVAMECNPERNLCEETFENVIRCDSGPKLFSTRRADDSGPTATCFDFTSATFTDSPVISFPCVKVQIPEFTSFMEWESGVAFPNPTIGREDGIPDWTQFRGWQVHMCGTQGFNDRVGFGLIIADAFYATEQALHVRNLDVNVEETNLRQGNGMSAEKCRTLSVNKDSTFHSPGFSWKSFRPNQSIRMNQFEIWVYQYPLDSCTGMEGVSCEGGKFPIITSANSELYMNQNINITMQCDSLEPVDSPDTPTSFFIKEASRALRNAWWEKFLSYIDIQRSVINVDVSFQIVNTVRAAFHDMLIGDKLVDGIPMGCLTFIGQHDPATGPFRDLKDGVDLDSVTRSHPDSMGRFVSDADKSVILGAMAIDWATQQARETYDWNENDNLLHKIRVGRTEVESEVCIRNKDRLEDRLPKHEVMIEDAESGNLREVTVDEPLFHPNEREGIQTRKGRMTAAHEEFRKKMLVGDMTTRDAVALMGGHGLGFIRILAEWAPLNEEDDCADLLGGPWTTQPHTLDNEYFIILENMLEVAESNMDAWTEVAPASTLWNAQDAIAWIQRCGADSPKVPVDTAKLDSSDGTFSGLDPTVRQPEDGPLFDSNLIMLDADLTLIFQDDTAALVKEFAGREITFLDAFHTAYVKLSENTLEELIAYTHPDGVPGNLLERNPAPTIMPTATDPSLSPSRSPTWNPTTDRPSNIPTTDEPTINPTTEEPSLHPSFSRPSRQPNRSPSPPPTPEPTQGPTTSEPSFSPSEIPTTETPTKLPTTETPTLLPSWAIPPYNRYVERWTMFGDVGTCQFDYQSYQQITTVYTSSPSACGDRCRANINCKSATIKKGSYCTLYNQIPSRTRSYTHGGKFSCWAYDGGRASNPAYHWMGWGQCRSQSNINLSNFQTLTTSTFETCVQQCRNRRCLSITWTIKSNRRHSCKLHRQYADKSQYGKASHWRLDKCYNIIYN